jgi:chorismate mutase
MDISDWRRKIDDLDHRLVKLLNERAKCVVEIGKIKLDSGLPVLESSREDEVMRHAVEANQGPLEGEAIRRVFESIVHESRGLQENLFGKADRTQERKA